MWLVNETEWRSPPVPYPSTQQDLGKRACRLKAYVRQKGIERPITIFEIMQLLEGSIVSLSDIGFFFFFFCLPVSVFCLPLSFLAALRLLSNSKPTCLAASLSPSLLPSISILPLASSPPGSLPSSEGRHREWRGRKVQVLVNC